jgi:uncharacterized protein YpmB
MQEIIQQSLNSLKELPVKIQALLIIAALIGVTTYGYFQVTNSGEEATESQSVNLQTGGTNLNTTGGGTQTVGGSNFNISN